MNIVIEPASYVHLVAGFESSQPWLRLVLPKIALFFDNVYCFDQRSDIDLLKNKPYGSFSDIAEEVSETFSQYQPPTGQQLIDLQLAWGDSPDSAGGGYAYYLIRAMLDFCEDKEHYFYVLPGFREGFISFCMKYHPAYLVLMKDSFLLCNLLEFIYEQYLPSFDPIRLQEPLKKFSTYKEDFQKGLREYLRLFRGSYMLSESQASYVKETIASDERRLLEFLRPENVRKFNLPSLELLAEAVSSTTSLLTSVPLPIGLLLSITKEIKQVGDFKKSNLSFVLSLTVLKKMANVGGAETRSLNCPVCAISLAEIENKSDEECMRLIHSGELCTEHMVARLDLKKRFRLLGKPLLKAMKELGDSSVQIA